MKLMLPWTFAEYESVVTIPIRGSHATFDSKYKQQHFHFDSRQCAQVLYWSKAKAENDTLLRGKEQRKEQGRVHIYYSLIPSKSSNLYVINSLPSLTPYTQKCTQPNMFKFSFDERRMMRLCALDSLNHTSQVFKSELFILLGWLPN